MRMLLLSLLLPMVVLAGDPPLAYKSHLTLREITLDGKLDDAAWSEVEWTDDFVDIEGSAKPAPRFRTRAKILYDDLNLYIAAELEEPHVWATISKRDDVIFHDNDFEVFIDPDGDSHQYGELEINAFNTQWDLFLPKPYKDNGHALDSWNIEGLQSAVYMNGTLNNPTDIDSGWSVEILLPWRGLEMCSHLSRFPVNDSWRINFSRVEWETEIVNGQYRKIAGRPEANWVWSPQGVIDMHRPERWGTVVFNSTAWVQTHPDRSMAWDLCEQVHRIYYAQREFRAKEGRWAVKESELPITIPAEYHVILEALRAGYEASVYPATHCAVAPLAKIRDDALFQVGQFGPFDD